MTDIRRNLETSFVGKVTIQSIQNEFDNIVAYINEMIDTANAVEEINEQDFSKGSIYLSGPKFTLTLGALKQILNSYDGCVLGGTTVKITDSSCKVFPSLYIDKDRGIVQIPDEYLAKNDNSQTLFYNPSTKDVGFPAGEWEESYDSSPSGTYTNLSNNNEFGNIYANNNTERAFASTRTSGWYYLGETSNGCDLCWDFSQEKELTDISLIWVMGGTYWFFAENANVSIFTKEGTLIATLVNIPGITSTQPTAIPISITGMSVKTSGIIIRMTGNMTGYQTNSAFSIKNLSITVKGSQYIINGTPSQEGIQDLTGYTPIENIDWVSGNDILNTTLSKKTLFEVSNKPNVVITNPNVIQATTNEQLDNLYNGDSNTTVGRFICPYTRWGSATPTTPAPGNTTLDGKVVSETDSWNSNWCWNPLWIPPNVANKLGGLITFCMNKYYKLVFKEEESTNVNAE